MAIHKPVIDRHFLDCHASLAMTNGLMQTVLSIFQTLSVRILLVATFLWAAGGSAWAADLSAQSAFKRLRPSVVEIRVEVKGNRGTSAGASGFVALRPDLVVTNYHAVTEALYEPEQHRI